MTPSTPTLRGRLAATLGGPLRLLAMAVPLALSACGGGVEYNGGGGGGGLTCSVPDQETWLAAYFDDQYYFYAHSPSFPPQTALLGDYFESLLYTGGDARYPGVTDIWSNYTSLDQFNRFYGDGQDLGFGVFVNGIEVQGHPELPLVVRYVDPGSPAAALGIARGDQITAVNGVAASAVISANDYSGLVASAAGQTLVLDTHNGSGDHHLSVLSSVYTLAPVANTRVFTSPGGRKVGYVMVKDMIQTALNPYDAAFAQFKANGVQEVVIDLRYNGGGEVGVGEILASYPATAVTSNEIYANLNFSDKQSWQDSYFTFDAVGNGLNLSRVYVLTGPRTCSAAEQLANGLAPYVEVVTIGSATCGKPFGFTPAENCGTVYNVVTFHASNVNYDPVPFTGIAPTCAVPEDFSAALGSDADPLLATASFHADNGHCPSACGAGSGAHPAVCATGRSAQAAPLGSVRSHWIEPNERQGMVKGKK